MGADGVSPYTASNGAVPVAGMYRSCLAAVVGKLENGYVSISFLLVSQTSAADEINFKLGAQYVIDK